MANSGQQASSQKWPARRSVTGNRQQCLDGDFKRLPWLSLLYSFVKWGPLPHALPTFLWFCETQMRQVMPGELKSMVPTQSIPISPLSTAKWPSQLPKGPMSRWPDAEARAKLMLGHSNSGPRGSRKSGGHLW